MRRLPLCWQSALRVELSQPYVAELEDFLCAERASSDVLPAEDVQTLAAFSTCAFDKVSVVIVGQDPYPSSVHATGLAFSVPRGVEPLPAALRNVYAELHPDVGVPISKTQGNLDAWAHEGVLLLNSVLTARANAPMSHACLLYTSPSPRDRQKSRMPSSA